MLRNKQIFLFLIPFAVFLTSIGIAFYQGTNVYMQEWKMMLTMLFGSMIAGATSEGGGAVAFPVMTLGLKISPNIARDFSLAIQSIGMTSATFLIWFKRIPIAHNILWPTLIGSYLGLLLGYSTIQDMLSATTTKYFFTALWLSFSTALWLSHKSRTDASRQNVEKSPHLVFLGIGFLGGVVSSLVGSGIDILTFSILTLYLRVCEKVATPTSVVIMAATSLMATIMKASVFGGLDARVLDMLLACAPVVTVGAPLGAFFISKRSPELIRKILYGSIFLQTVWAWAILPKSAENTVLFSMTFIVGSLIFWVAHKKGDTHSL